MHVNSSLIQAIFSDFQLMYRFINLAAFCMTLSAVFTSSQVSHAGLILVSGLTDAWVVDSNGDPLLRDGSKIFATAANGVVFGNDVGAQGNLLALLNATTETPYIIGANTGIGSSGINVSTSDTGLFSTNSSGSNPIAQGDTIDLLYGTKLEAEIVKGVRWTQVAKNDPSNTEDEFFTVSSDAAYLDYALTDLAVISLKLGTGYAVYAFDLRGISDAYGFGFSTDSFAKQELSHATLLTAVGKPLGGEVPEPSSLAIFGLGGLGLGLMGLRRRKANRQSA